MKYTYSGFHNPDKKKKRGGFTAIQIVPMALVLIVFLITLQFRSMNAEKKGDSEGNNSNPTIVEVISSPEIRFYYAVKSQLDYTLYYTDLLPEIKPGNGILKVLEFGLKNPPNDSYVKTIPDGVSVNFISTDGESAQIDFSASFDFGGEALNYAEEAAMLKAAAFTFGTYFKVARVYITVNGDTYISKNIILDEFIVIE